MKELEVPTLVDMIRQHMNDTYEPYLVPEWFILQAIDTAQQELVDQTQPLTATHTLAVTAGTASYALPDNLAQIRRGVSATHQNTLHPLTLNQFDDMVGSWRTNTGTPRYIITDEVLGHIRLYPEPVVDDTVTLTVFQHTTPIEALTDDLSVPARMRPALVTGALATLYGMQDAEVYNPQLADRFTSLWYSQIRTLHGLHERDTRGPGVTRFNRTGVW